MPVTINGSTGITDADGGTVLSSADIATQAEAQAGTDNTKVMTPLRVADAISSRIFSQSQLFTASGTFNTPAGVTQVYAVVAAAGGGGSGYNSGGSAAGQYGGFGGLAVGIISVSGAMAVTVGTGGTGGATGASGTAGGTSSFGTLSATGGGGGTTTVIGANGVGSGGTFNTNIGAGTAFQSALAVPVTSAFLQTSLQEDTSALTTVATPVAYSLTGVGRPGARGAPGNVSTLPGNIGDGGTGGAVFIFW